jgi:hypothetical protein
MDGIQHAFGSGQCLHAMNSGTTVLVGDTKEDARWPEYGQAIAILVNASSGRNQKLRTLAEQLVSSISVQGPSRTSTRDRDRPAGHRRNGKTPSNGQTSGQSTCCL